jgi:hypothetical protein
MSRKKHDDKASMLPVQSRLLFYRTEDGRTRIEVRLQDETVWMTQATIAELYQTTPQNITLHLKAIYHEVELDPQATRKEFLQVQFEGSRFQRNDTGGTTLTTMRSPRPFKPMPRIEQ